MPLDRLLLAPFSLLLLLLCLLDGPPDLPEFPATCLSGAGLLRGVADPGATGCRLMTTSTLAMSAPLLALHPMPCWRALPKRAQNVA